MAEPIQVDFEGRKRRKAGPKMAVIPPERAGLRIILSVIGALITAAVAYYIMLPPINLKAKEFYYYLILVIASFVVLLFMLCKASSRPEYVPFVKKTSLIPGLAIGLVVVFFAVAWAISSPFFQAKKYSEIMPVNEDVSFVEDIKEQDFSVIPKLDADAAKVVADRTLGALADYVSQFTISTNNTQINYREKPVRVVTLGYADVIKWLTNTRQGLPGYVIVDMANEKSEFIQLENRIRYSDAEHFGKLLKRHLRFRFPTYMFGEINFEIDDSNNPYWIAPRIDKTVGLLGGEDVVGIVIVNAVTGECKEYDIDIVRNDPGMQWIDRVYSATLVNTQFNYHGKYQSGFWNSILGQKGVRVTTAGNSYLAKDDDVYMYTGVTSATADSSIIGFILVNQRTKEANFYQMKGATENSAMEVAKGLVSDYKWQATFPLLINVSGQPTYFLSLTDDSKVVQGYSMVNVDQYNKIKVWGKTVAECINLYGQALKENSVKPVEPDPEKPDEEETTAPAPSQDNIATGKVADIRTAVIGGNTTYYIQLEGNPAYYTITAAQYPAVVLLNKGTTVTIAYIPAEGNILRAASIN